MGDWRQPFHASPASEVFGFLISWATNTSVVVGACTKLADPAWLPVSTNALNGGSAYFRGTAAGLRRTYLKVLGSYLDSE